MNLRALSAGIKQGTAAFPGIALKVREENRLKTAQEVKQRQTNLSNRLAAEKHQLDLKKEVNNLLQKGIPLEIIKSMLGAEQIDQIRRTPDERAAINNFFRTKEEKELKWNDDMGVFVGQSWDTSINDWKVTIKRPPFEEAYAWGDWETLDTDTLGNTRVWRQNHVTNKTELRTIRKDADLTSTQDAYDMRARLVHEAVMDQRQFFEKKGPDQIINDINLTLSGGVPGANALTPEEETWLRDSISIYTNDLSDVIGQKQKNALGVWDMIGRKASGIMVLIRAHYEPLGERVNPLGHETLHNLQTGWLGADPDKKLEEIIVKYKQLTEDVAREKTGAQINDQEMDDFVAILGNASVSVDNMLTRLQNAIEWSKERREAIFRTGYTAKNITDEAVQERLLEQVMGPDYIRAPTWLSKQDRLVWKDLQRRKLLGSDHKDRIVPGSTDAVLYKELEDRINRYETEIAEAALQTVNHTIGR